MAIARRSADAYIFAVPHDALHELMPQNSRRRPPSLQNLHKIKVSPITGVHLWFDRDRDGRALRHASRHQHPVDLQQDRPLRPKRSPYEIGVDLRQPLTIPADGHQRFLRFSEKIAAGNYRSCLTEVRQPLPRAQQAELLKATVIKEAAATFSPQPGVDRWRPPQQTKIPQLFFSGDWTATGWPATMEGAVRSGYLAAEAVLRSAGTPKQFLQPDLPPSGLISLWAKEEK